MALLESGINCTSTVHLPPRPAPATPNSEPTTAAPAAVPRNTAPPPPNTAPMRGAANPPVSPTVVTKVVTQ